MKKILFIAICVLAFLLEMLIVIYFKDIIIAKFYPENPSISIQHSVNNERFIARLITDTNLIFWKGKKYQIKESWIELRKRLFYNAPFSFIIKPNGYYYCFVLELDSNKSRAFQEKPTIAIGDQTEFSLLRRSKIKKDLYYTKAANFKPDVFSLVSFDKTNPQGSNRYRVSIDYFNAAIGSGQNYSYSEATTKPWYAFPVKHDQGFNPFFVPFDYQCRDCPPEKNQELVFPFLLSFKFDFVDNNICMRCPAFIFQRDESVQKLKIDNTLLVVKKMKEWGKNVAIGGTLIQRGDLYSGSIKILNENQVFFEKNFKDSSYFELMGKMVSAWIDFSGGTISDELMTELVRPMTTSKRAIKMVGELFKHKMRSNSQWELYENILKLDPDFAELRWWYTNQKWWQNRDWDWSNSMNLTALGSHIVVRALREVEHKHTPWHAKQYEQELLKAKTIIPKHWVIKNKAYYDKWDQMERSEVINLSKEANELPYAYYFASKAARECYYNEDYQFSVPLMLSIINSKFNPGEGWRNEYARLVFSFQLSGYLRDAAALISPMFKNSNHKETASLYAGYTLDEALNYRMATELYKYSLRIGENKNTALQFLINAYLDAGMHSEVQKLTKNKEWPTLPDELQLVFKGRLYTNKGELTKARRLLSDAKGKLKNRNGYYRRFLETALIEFRCKSDLNCIRNKKDPFWNHSPNKKRAAWYSPVDNLWLQSPRSRKTYLWYKKVYKNDLYKLRDYLYVAKHIFPNQLFWEKEYKSLPLVQEPSVEEVVDRFNYIQSTRLRPSWSGGFRIEYICLRLLLEGTDMQRDDVIRFYRKYANQEISISQSLKVHRMTFLAYLENLNKPIGQAERPRS